MNKGEEDIFGGGGSLARLKYRINYLSGGNKANLPSTFTFFPFFFEINVISFCRVPSRKAKERKEKRKVKYWLDACLVSRSLPLPFSKMVIYENIIVNYGVWDVYAYFAETRDSKIPRLLSRGKGWTFSIIILSP